MVAKTILKTKRTAGSLPIPDFKLHYKATVRKTACYLHKAQNADQCIQIEDSYINPHSYEHMIFDLKK